MKILYAASNRIGAAQPINRFIHAIENKNYELKIAAYLGPQFIKPIDWNLSALINFLHPELMSFKSNDLEIYCEQVKSYNPDLIISDLEPYTSHVASALNIPIWQVSSNLLYTSLEHKYNVGIYKHYSYIFNRHTELTKNQLYNSDMNFVYSHFGDLINPPALKEKFDWIRPYHLIGKISPPCQYESLIASLGRNKNINNLLKNKDDAVWFSDFTSETYPQIKLKDINNFSEYSCNLKNCQKFYCSGVSDFLADAFYNGKFSWILTDFEEDESILNSVLSDHFGLGKMLYEIPQELEKVEAPECQYNGNIKFLDEKIEEIFNC